MIRIAIDGPGGAGKSTIARLLAARLSLEYVDTGAMYRAIGLKLMESGISADDEAAVADILDETDVDFAGGRIYLDGKDVSDMIRSREASMAASACSKLACVRDKLVAVQRRIAAGTGVVMDGRDIGTNVIPDAEVKIFLTADPMVRAERRYRELIAAGKEVGLDTIYDEIRARDHQDANRELNPLVQAEDAVLLDTSYMTIDEVVDRIEGETAGFLGTD